MGEQLNSLKRKAEEYVRVGDYGLLRNCLLKLSNLNRDKGNFDKELMYTMCCCYLDINGPNNTSGGSTEKEMKGFYQKNKLWDEWEHYHFNPQNHGSFAPAIIATLKQDLGKGKYSMEEYFNEFMENAIELCEDLNTLIAPTPAWKKLKTEIEE